jgi:large subunit ribosomal protein L23
MSNARDIIVRPLITEKTMKLQAEDNKVTFEVARSANKTQVKLAIEEIFNVKVEKVNIVNVRPRTKRVGKYVGQKVQKNQYQKKFLYFS